MDDKIKIHWVNHASFIVSYKNIRLMSDPWLFGPVFNNGWDLLVKTPFSMDDFGKVTHIWFSHEHPDHFCPPVIKKIPEQYRKNITVLFQTTKDHKVIEYCRNLGFKTRELPDHKWFNLTDDFKVMCGRVPFIDSWLFMEAGGQKVLNVNDCVVDSHWIVKEILQNTGTIDVLLTQFSYANWGGNPEQIMIRKELAREKFASMKLQIEALRPKHTVPFASFVYYSNEDNAYHNDAINTVFDALEFLKTETSTTPVILYPGDEWAVGQAHDNKEALEKYKKDYDIFRKPLRKNESIPKEKLSELAKQYIARLYAHNNRFFIWLLSRPPFNYFQPVHIYLMDLRTTVGFDLKNGLYDVDVPPDNAHAAMASDSLAYIFQHDWGLNTLNVNGRFRASQKNYRKLKKTLFLGILNNTGRTLRLKQLLDLHFFRWVILKKIIMEEL
ncbi:MAG TPA: MBL fold metallo-hydrolase [Candidatus Omnitrophota bacterium]|nr:MBL fold metallo-hydrolase [Candidatus Omnitrophota bacterium]